MYIKIHNQKVHENTQPKKGTIDIWKRHDTCILDKHIPSPLI